jgi:hypothetical protein
VEVEVAALLEAVCAATKPAAVRKVTTVAVTRILPGIIITMEAEEKLTRVSGLIRYD